MPLGKFSEEYLNTVLDDGLTIREHMRIGLENAIQKEKQSENPKFHRTFEEKEQSFNFHEKYKKKIEKLENCIYLCAGNEILYDPNNISSIKKAIKKCDKSISSYEKLKCFCYTHGGRIYFQDRWEYCHNSQSDCFAYITSIMNTKEKLINLTKKIG